MCQPPGPRLGTLGKKLGSHLGLGRFSTTYIDLAVFSDLEFPPPGRKPGVCFQGRQSATLLGIRQPAPSPQPPQGRGWVAWGNIGPGWNQGGPGSGHMCGIGPPGWLGLRKDVSQELRSGNTFRGCCRRRPPMFSFPAL
jgi:hypothetical protein